MKRFIAVCCALLVCAFGMGAAAGESAYENMSLDELLELQSRISAIIAQKKADGAQTAAPVQDGVTLRELFPDTDFAKAIRSALNKTSIDRAVTQSELDGIVKLDLSRNDGYVIHSFEGISHLRNLQVLRINCSFTSAYGAQYRLHENWYVFAGTELPDEIGLLQNLTEISIQNTPLLQLPEGMRNLVNLRKLEIYYTGLTAIPEWIGELQKLESIVMTHSFVATVPDSIGQLTSLKTLKLTDSEITELPDSICGLPNLQTLDVGYTNLKALPENIGSLTTLKTLSVNSTPITKLPASLENLQLTELDIDNTSIE